MRKTPGKFLGSLPQRYVGAGRQKLFQPEFTQNFNGGIPRTLGFYVAANIGNIDVIAFAGTFTQCFRNICIAKAILSQRNNRQSRWKTMNLLGQNGLCSAA